MVSAALIVSIIVAAIAVAIAGAWFAGVFQPLIEKIALYFFKAKAKAEVTALKAQGKKEGVDFLEGELKGNKQAEGVANEGLDALKKGGIGGIKL